MFRVTLVKAWFFATFATTQFAVILTTCNMERKSRIFKTAFWRGGLGLLMVGWALQHEKRKQ